VRIENFLDPAQMAALLNWAVRMRDKFAPSSVTTGIENYRRSRVIHDLAEARPPGCGGGSQPLLNNAWRRSLLDGLTGVKTEQVAAFVVSIALPALLRPR
jgi:hypothetical protein